MTLTGASLWEGFLEGEAEAVKRLVRKDVRFSTDFAHRLKGPIFLKPLRRKAERFPFWTFDFEAEPWEGTVRRQCTWTDGRQVWETPVGRKAASDFLVWLRDRDEWDPKTILYAHNLSYDGAFLMEGASDLGMQKNPFYRNRLLALKVRLSEDREVEFRDSWALTFTGLEKLTREFGVEHQKLDVDKANSEDASVPRCPLHKGEFCPSAKFFDSRYRRNDVLGLWEVLEKMFRLLEWDVSLTLAATSMRVFRRKYLEFPIFRNTKYSHLQRHAYSGARTEVVRFNEEAGKFFDYYDVNSLYPSVMEDLEVPVGPAKQVKADISGSGFTYATVWEDPVNPFPALPVKGGKLFFTAGKKIGYYCNEELREAKERGSRLTLHTTFETRDTSPIFRSFVRDMYGRRLQAKKESNGSLAFVLKLILNSNYGKWGQKPSRTEFFFDPTTVPSLAVPMNVEHTAWRHETDKDSAHIIPIIAAMITARARLRLLREIDRLEPECIFYMDTDSLLLDKPGIRASDRLGEFKHEGRIHSFFVFGPKVYAFRDEEEEAHLKMKGVSAHAGDDELKFKERLEGMLDFVQGRPVHNQAGILNLLSALKISDGKRYAFPKSLTRSFAGEYDKRQVRPDGSTLPWDWDGVGVPKTFANPAFKPVLARVTKSFVREYQP